MFAVCLCKLYQAYQGTTYEHTRFSKYAERCHTGSNHVSFAARSILTELHESMDKDSRELEEAVSRFAKEFKKLSQPKDQRERSVKWKPLFKSGARKASGDVFLAVIGAFTMDLDYFEAEQLMQPRQ